MPTTGNAVAAAPQMVDHSESSADYGTPHQGEDEIWSTVGEESEKLDVSANRSSRRLLGQTNPLEVVEER